MACRLLRSPAEIPTTCAPIISDGLLFATDGTGAVVWDASYKPFGEVNASTGALINLRYPGQWFSSESDLNQNWMRDYDPTLGRYIQTDPLGLVDGASVYGYALQSPNRYIDPRGECAGVCTGIGVAAVWGYRAYRAYRAAQLLADAIGSAGASAGAATINSAEKAGEEGKEAAEEAAVEGGAKKCKYGGQTPDDNEDNFKKQNGKKPGDKDFINKSDGSYWSKERSSRSPHGGSAWKRWNSKRDFLRDTEAEKQSQVMEE